MLVSVPFLSFLIVFLDLVGLQRVQKLRIAGWRTAFLQTIVLMGVMIVAQSELLSLFSALTQLWVAALWGLALIVSLGFGWRFGLLVEGWKEVIHRLRSLSKLEVLFGSALGAIFLLLSVVAYLSPPNNLDSLGYHMSRVVHWAQDRSIAHYAVAYQVQLLNPIMAEITILNLRLLWGSDQLSNFVQWFSMVGSLIGVSLLAGVLGVGRKGQLAAVAFAASVPMGVLQATSTQNDYVTTLWLICLAVFVVQAIKQEPGVVELFCIAAPLGLGLLTKGTYYPYAVPLGIWLIVHWLRQRQLLAFLKRGALIVAVVVLLNLGFWARNTITFGGPLGPEKWVSGQTSGDIGVFALAARLVENTVLNFTPPDKATTRQILAAVRFLFAHFYPGIKSFNLIWGWNHEDMAGNPVHLILMAVSLVVLVLLKRAGRVEDRNILWYGLTVLATFFTLALVVHYDQYGTRFQLPFVVSWGPVFGFVLAKLGERRLATTAAFLLLLAALPWVFFNRSRPLIGITNQPEMFSIRPIGFTGTTNIGSILITPPTTILFANRLGLLGPYIHMIRAIEASGCTQVGLRIDSHDIEYQFWWMLGAPQNGTRIEAISYPDILTRYADPAFKPCAIICTTCEGRNRLHGLNLASPYGKQAWLFLGETYDPDKDE
jgi:hypothetical protein